MYHVDSATAVTSRPAVKALVSKERLYYTNGNPSMGVPATILEADHLNTIQNEILNFIEAAGFGPDKLDDKQMLQAVRKFIAIALGRDEWDEETTAPAPSIPIWDRKSDYETAPFIVWGSDNELYTLERPSGPNVLAGGSAVGPKDPTSTTGYWRNYRRQVSGIPGEIRLLPYRFNRLPEGWYFGNGQRYAHTSNQAKALLALDEYLQQDLGITNNPATGVNVPDLFRNGKGVFLRAVNGTTRLPGSIEQDGGRQIAGTAASTASSLATSGGSVNVSATGKIEGLSTPHDFSNSGAKDPAASGVFTLSGTKFSQGFDGGGRSVAWQDAVFNLSQSYAVPAPTVRTTVNTSVTITQANIADEYRALNIGMTPAIYLGV